MSTPEPRVLPRQTSIQFVLYTAVASAVDSLAAWASAAVALEVWIMFAGFIASFTRPAALHDGLSAMLCLWLGIGLAAISLSGTSALIPVVGSLALPAVVFPTAIMIVGLHTTRFVNNMLSWFLAVVTFFAAHKAFVRNLCAPGSGDCYRRIRGLALPGHQPPLG